MIDNFIDSLLNKCSAIKNINEADYKLSPREIIHFGRMRLLVKKIVYPNVNIFEVKNP